MCFLAAQTAFPRNNSAGLELLADAARFLYRLNSKERGETSTPCRVRARFLYRRRDRDAARLSNRTADEPKVLLSQQRPSRVCLRSFFAVHLLLPGSPSPTPRNPQVAGVRAGYRHRLAAVPVSVIAWSSPGPAAFSCTDFFFFFLPRRARAIEVSRLAAGEICRLRRQR